MVDHALNSYKARKNTGDEEFNKKPRGIINKFFKAPKRASQFNQAKGLLA